MKFPSYRKSLRDKPNTTDVSMATKIKKATAYFVTIFARLLDSVRLLRNSLSFRHRRTLLNEPLICFQIGFIQLTTLKSRGNKLRKRSAFVTNLQHGRLKFLWINIFFISFCKNLCFFLKNFRSITDSIFRENAHRLAVLYTLRSLGSVERRQPRDGEHNWMGNCSKILVNEKNNTNTSEKSDNIIIQINYPLWSKEIIICVDIT